MRHSLEIRQPAPHAGARDVRARRQRRLARGRGGRLVRHEGGGQHRRRLPAGPCGGARGRGAAELPRHVGGLVFRRRGSLLRDGRLGALRAATIRSGDGQGTHWRLAVQNPRHRHGLGSGGRRGCAQSHVAAAGHRARGRRLARVPEREVEFEKLSSYGGGVRRRHRSQRGRLGAGRWLPVRQAVQPDRLHRAERSRGKLGPSRHVRG
mmetsp:Transcript_15937/g.55550  ORF Transcript_15937/g.55550 Transcript_15937/m.55550 type:complete len:208 (+) Transcript_15937:384-1007(+)